MNNELSIHGLLLVLKRRRAMIFWTVSVSLLLGMVTCAFLKPRYRAIGEIEIQKSATDGLGLENLTSPAEESADALDATIALQTQTKILQSKSLALKVIEDLNLENTEDFKPRFNPISWTMGLLEPGGERDPLGASLEDSPRRRDHAIKVFAKHLKVLQQGGTRLVEIQYTSTDPRIAAAVVNEMSKSLVDFTLNSRYAATSQVSNWLSGQLEDIKKEAAGLQGKVEQLQRESGIYSLGISDAQGKEVAYSATLDKLQQATGALSVATSNRILKGGLYKMVQNGDPELISDLAGTTLAGASSTMSNSFQLLQDLRSQHAALQVQYATDLSKYGSANPKLIDEKASLDANNSEIRAEVKRIGERAENDYRASQIVEGNTRAVYDQERKSADNMNDKAIELLIARQEATDARNLYQTLFSHLKEAGVLEGLRSSNVSVIDPGRVPSKPVPDIPMVLALSLFCGCFVGVGGALFADATNKRVEGMASIENALHTNILGVLPTTHATYVGVSRAGLSTKVRRRLVGQNRQSPEAGRLAILDGPNSAYLEALRGLRTSLLNPSAGDPPKTILITSPSEQEGKSTVSLNLAAALALNGSRVLLVDADMRSAGLSGYMGFERRPSSLFSSDKSGLSNALKGSVEPAIVVPFPEFPNLSALPAGPPPTYPAELLGSEGMRKLIKTWSNNFDYVLIDSPPILAVTDAHILSQFVDATLLIARHGRSTQKSVERAYQTLHNMAGRKVNLVVNGVQRDSVSYGEFYGYQGTSYYSEV